MCYFLPSIDSGTLEGKTFLSTGTKLVCQKLIRWQGFLGNGCGGRAFLPDLGGLTLLSLDASLLVWHFEMIGFLIYFYSKPHLHGDHQNRLWITGREQWHFALGENSWAKCVQSKQGMQQPQSALPADLSHHILTARGEQSLSASQHKSLLSWCQQ